MGTSILVNRGNLRVDERSQQQSTKHGLYFQLRSQGPHMRGPRLKENTEGTQQQISDNVLSIEKTYQATTHNVGGKYHPNSWSVSAYW